MNTFSARLAAGLAKGGDGPIPIEMDPMRAALLSGDRATLQSLVQSGADPDAVLEAVQRMAESAYCVRPVLGKSMRLHLVAWPFLLNFGRAGGRVPAQVDMGSANDPAGARFAQLWAAMVCGAPDVHVVPLRLGVHAHGLYDVSPDMVQSLVGDAARVIGAPGARIPRGIGPSDSSEPKSALGALHAPILLQALVVAPEGVQISFFRDLAAMDTARQLVAAKFGLTTVTPTVHPGMPAPFFTALESMLQMENLAMARWEGGEDVNVRIDFAFDGKGSKSFKRELAMQIGHGGQVHAVTNTFDLRWFTQRAVRGSLADIHKVKASGVTRQHFLDGGRHQLN